MAEVTIKSHSRRSKSGKTIQVRGYTRRVGRKGIKSPKRTKEEPGEEFVKKVEETASKRPVLTKEDIERRKEWEKSFARVETERKRLGMSREQYSRYIRSRKDEPSQKRATTSSRQSVEKKHKDVFEKMEDKIAKFVEKYSGKKYKR